MSSDTRGGASLAIAARDAPGVDTRGSLPAGHRVCQPAAFQRLVDSARGDPPLSHRAAGRATSPSKTCWSTSRAYVPLGFLLARAFMRRVRHRARGRARRGARRASSQRRDGKRADVHAVAHRVERRRAHQRARRRSSARWRRRCSRRRACSACAWRGCAAQWFVYGPSADVGLVLLCLWLATQLHPDRAALRHRQPARHVRPARSGSSTRRLSCSRPKPRSRASTCSASGSIVARARRATAMPRGVALAARARGGVRVTKAYRRPAIAEVARRPSPGSHRRASACSPARSLLYGARAMPRAGAVDRRGAAASRPPSPRSTSRPDNPYQTVPPQFLAGPDATS